MAPQNESPAVLARLRGLMESLLSPPEPSPESRSAIPELVITLLLVIREQPRFAQRLLTLEALPPATRDQELQKMSATFRAGDAPATVAEGFDRLRDPKLFRAFCQVLREAN
jgi:hypothetical protein